MEMLLHLYDFRRYLDSNLFDHMVFALAHSYMSSDKRVKLPLISSRFVVTKSYVLRINGGQFDFYT